MAFPSEGPVGVGHVVFAVDLDDARVLNASVDTSRHFGREYRLIRNVGEVNAVVACEKANVTIERTPPARRSFKEVKAAVVIQDDSRIKDGCHAPGVETRD